MINYIWAYQAHVEGDGFRACEEYWFVLHRCVERRHVRWLSHSRLSGQYAGTKHTNFLAWVRFSPRQSWSRLLVFSWRAEKTAKFPHHSDEAEARTAKEDQGTKRVVHWRSVIGKRIAHPRKVNEDMRQTQHIVSTFKALYHRIFINISYQKHANLFFWQKSSSDAMQDTKDEWYSYIGSELYSLHHHIVRASKHVYCLILMLQTGL